MKVLCGNLNRSDLIKKIVKNYYNNVSNKYVMRHLTPYPDFLDTEDELIGEIIRPPMKVLEIGSGYGRRYLTSLSAKYIVIDISESMLKKLMTQVTFQNLIVADAGLIPFKPFSFDVILLTYNTLGHVQGTLARNKILKGINNVLKNDGIFILSVWLKGMYSTLDLSKYNIVKRYKDGGMLLIEHVNEQKYPIYVKAFTSTEICDALYTNYFKEIKKCYINYQGDISTNYKEGYDYLITIATKECGDN